MVDERKKSETKRSVREMARPILFDGRRPWARVRTIPGFMHNARLVRGWKRLAGGDASLVMQGASGECGIDAGELMIFVLWCW
jgi:hypothetical protein